MLMRRALWKRIRDLCRQFRLPTLAAETVDRFSDAGHADALPTLMEVLEHRPRTGGSGGWTG